jgi:hypothetical protein
MDWPRFLSLLQTSSITLSRIDNLGDPHEGAINQLALDGLLRSRLAQGIPEDIAERDARYFKALRRSLQTHQYASCWHESDHESAAMWNHYTTAGHGIAIRIDFGRLVAAAAVPPEPPFYSVGRVRYIHYGERTSLLADVYPPLLHKRKAYEHEHEVRLLTMIPSNPVNIVHPDLPEAELARWFELNVAPTAPFVRLEVDLHELQEVLVSPSAPDWLVDVIREAAAPFLACPVRRSPLLLSPPILSRGAQHSRRPAK